MTDEAGKGSEEKGKGEAGAPQGDTVSKADFDKIMGENTKLSQQMEDLRLEVLSPDYMEFLDSKEKGIGDKGKQQEPVKKASDITDDSLEKMSKKDIFDLAKKAAKDEMDGEFKRLRDEQTESSNAGVKREIAAFARTHGDYETFRPIMLGLSKDPKNFDLTLEELYVASKEHIKRIGQEPSEAEKEKQRKKQGEKPGGSNDSYEEDRKLSAEEATKRAVASVREQLGPLPV